MCKFADIDMAKSKKRTETQHFRYSSKFWHWTTSDSHASPTRCCNMHVATRLTTWKMLLVCGTQWAWILLYHLVTWSTDKIRELTDKVVPVEWCLANSTWYAMINIQKFNRFKINYGRIRYVHCTTRLPIPATRTHHNRTEFSGAPDRDCVHPSVGSLEAKSVTSVSRHWQPWSLQFQTGKAACPIQRGWRHTGQGNNAFIPCVRQASFFGGVIS